MTKNEIKDLKHQALVNGAYLLADCCAVVLCGEDSDGTGTALGAPITVEAAQKQIDAYLRSDEG